MRQPTSSAAARFNERLAATKKKYTSASTPKETFNLQQQFIGFISMSGELAEEDAMHESFERGSKLDCIVESTDEDDEGHSPKDHHHDDDDSSTMAVRVQASPFAASPSAVTFLDRENPFRKQDGTLKVTESDKAETWSPTHVEEFDTCLQPQLSPSKPIARQRFEQSLKPKNLHASGLMDSKEALPCVTCLEQRTLMPKNDNGTADAGGEDDVAFHDAVQGEEEEPPKIPPQKPQQPQDRDCRPNTTHAFRDAHAASVNSGGGNGYSAKVSLFNEKPSVQVQDDSYSWDSIKSSIMLGLNSQSAYLKETFFECQQPSDSGDSLAPLHGIGDQVEASVVSGYESLKRSFSSFSLDEVSTSVHWDGESPGSTKSSPTQNNVTHMKAAQEPTQGQKDDFALQDESTSKVVLYIDHYGPSTFFRLMKELKYNERVKELHIFRSWNDEIKRSRNKADICIMFDAIRTLPRLCHLSLSNFLPEELDGVTQVQWQNPRLTSLRIHVCKGALSKGLLKRLAKIPELRDLALEVTQSFPFQSVLSNELLQTLSIAGNDFVWQHEHIIELVYVLHKSSTLKRLSLEPAMYTKTFKFLAYGLNANAGIEDLRVHVLPGASSVETNEALQELCRTLLVNTTLKSAWNTNYSSLRVTDQVSKSLINAFSKNGTIQEFLMFEEEPAFHYTKESLLKENQQSSVPLLQDFYLPGCGTVESLQQVATTKDPNNDNLSLVDSMAMDYAVVGSSIARFGRSVKNLGMDIFGVVAETAVLVNQAMTTTRSSKAGADVNTSAEESDTTAGVESTFSGSTVTA